MSAVVIWVIIGTVLLVAEIFSPTFIMMFFGIGAFGAAVTALIHPSILGELAAFAAVSAASLFILRSRLLKTFRGSKSDNTRNGARFPYSGRLAEVTADILPGAEGEISLGGSFWRAKCDSTVHAGEKVRVLYPDRDDELLLIVRPAGQA
ncbi:MAG: NfeD family protein [Mailhella sp.]|nr:NfeD family protein [Mailhella sp.]